MLLKTTDVSNPYASLAKQTTIKNIKEQIALFLVGKTPCYVLMTLPLMTLLSCFLVCLIEKNNRRLVLPVLWLQIHINLFTFVQK